MSARRSCGTRPGSRRARQDRRTRGEARRAREWGSEGEKQAAWAEREGQGVDERERLSSNGSNERGSGRRTDGRTVGRPDNQGERENAPGKRASQRERERRGDGRQGHRRTVVLGRLRHGRSKGNR